MRLGDRFKRLTVFMGLNFCLSLLIGISYIFFSTRSIFELFFVSTALVSNTVMIYAALFIPASLLNLLPGGRLLAGALLGFFQLALLTDVCVYKVWRFHLNSMVFNLLTTPGGIASLEQGWDMKCLYLLLAAGLLSLQWLFLRWAIIIVEKVWSRSRFLKTSAVLLLFVVADKGMFAWGTLYDCVSITSNDDLFPIYQPLTLRSFANRYFGFKLNSPLHVSLDKKYSSLDYPRSPLVIDPPKKPLNIVIMVIDSMRYDMFSKDITPNLWKLGKKAIVFSNHYSGGNCTRFGIFSLIYGIYGKYWFPMLGERRGPVLIDVLKKEGYDIRLFAGSMLSFPEFDKTCFVNAPVAGIYDHPEHGDGSVRDIDITDKAVQYITHRPQDKPYFVFVFYDASHGSYDYVPEFEKFRPSYAINPLLVNRDNILPLFNKYKNAISFDDHEVGRILDAISVAGGMKDTVIIITGDHGEAFFEKDYYGHNHSYSAEEVRVPFVYYQPGLKNSVVISTTSHLDIAPTLLQLLGVKNPVLDYSNGYGLFTKKKWRYIPVFSWDTAAIVRDSETIVIPMKVYKGGVKVYSNTTWKEKGRPAAASFMPLLLDFQKEAVRFLK